MNNLKYIKGKNDLPRKKKKAMKKLTFEYLAKNLNKAWSKLSNNEKNVWHVTEEEGKRITEIMAKD